MPRHQTDSWQSYLGPGAASSLLLATAAAAGGLGIPLWWQLRRVLRAAAGDPPRTTDVVLVLGRALVRDQPSPVFVARLEHGAALVTTGRAPRLVIAGGLTGDASRTEAAAGREYLLARGFPAAQLALEDRSRHTLENLFNVRQTLRAEGWRTLTLVSDPLHLARASALARGLGLDVDASPAVAAPPVPGSPGWWRRAATEAAFLHWYHVGVLYSRAIRSEKLLSRVT
jgi:uncharacterized SAM-binding protein YcdF (DUF218 family)